MLKILFHIVGAGWVLLWTVLAVMGILAVPSMTGLMLLMWSIFTLPVVSLWQDALLARTEDPLGSRRLMDLLYCSFLSVLLLVQALLIPVSPIVEYGVTPVSGIVIMQVMMVFIALMLARGAVDARASLRESFAHNRPQQCYRQWIDERRLWACANRARKAGILLS